MDLDMKLKFNFNKRNRYKNICSIEGCNNSACGKYCNKHYHQIKRYGNIKTRTRFDKNEIIINDNVAKILLYNNDCNVIDYTIIDVEDINKISKYKISKCGNYASHGNSGGSAPWEINLVQKLCDWDIISPLRFTDDEWSQISSDGTCQNRRKSNVFKEPNGSIHYNEAFIKRPISRYNFDTKEWTDNKNPICWHGGLFEYKDNILTGRYFSICLLQQYDINKGWMPKPTQIIDCVEVEISPENWIMAVDINNIDLIKLDINYNIQWEECSCLKGIRLEDVTEELEDKAYEEMRNNK